MVWRVNKILEYTDWLDGRGQGKMGGGRGLYAAMGNLLGVAGPYSRIVKEELIDEFGCSERQYERYVSYAWQTQGYKNRHKWRCGCCGGTVKSRRELRNHNSDRCYEETMRQVKEVHGEEYANDPKIQETLRVLTISAKITFSRISGKRIKEGG
jgi:hypothetical protein